MRVTVFYSPSFTSECFRDLKVDKPRFEKVVGDAGLLDFLELKLGLAAQDTAAIDRILAFQKAMDAVKQDAFYEKAFENDPLATAKEILRWRDLLVMEGFDASSDHKSPRLRKLAEIESSFHMTGTPERWKRICEQAPRILGEVEIVVRHDIQLLPKLIRDALAFIGVEKGQYDGLGDQDGMSLDPNREGITVMHFGTVAEAYRWAVDNNDCEVVICPEPLRMNAVLRNREKPLLDASVCGDSSILQLPRLGLLLLERPLHINNLLEFLRTGFSPIPAEPRYALAQVLKSEGGLGEKWERTLSGYKEIPEIKTFLTSLIDAEVSSDGKVAKQTVLDWCRALCDSEWSNKMRTPDRLPYQLELTDLCRNLCRVIDNEPGGDVEVSRVLKAVKTLYVPKPFRKDTAMAGSWNAIENHRCLIDLPKSLLWLPCNGGLGTPYPYSFLMQEEAEELGIKSKTVYTRFDFNLMAQWLDKIDTIVLCACDFDRNEALEEHPAVTLCMPAAKSAGKELDKRISVEGSATSVFQRLHTLDTGTDLYPRDKKGTDKEEDLTLSATSIETLISFPFDFVMEKKLGFHDISSLQLSDLTPTQGNVAHYVFQRMMDDSVGEIQRIAKMRKMLGKDVFEKRVLAAAKEKGALLLLPENRTMFSYFTETIQKSIENLLDILDDNQLTPMECEHPLEVALDYAKVRGSVDFYAETMGGDIVVIDFKYSKGTTYIEKIENDESIQLEMYAEGLYKELGRPVVAKGYYFFPINQLHTADEGFFREDGIKVIRHMRQESETPLSIRIKDSVNLRKHQLKAGTLEMEEGYPLEDIDYHKQSNEGAALIDIPAAREKANGKDVKASSPFANPTKFPVLKNSIK